MRAGPVLLAALILSLTASRGPAAPEEAGFPFRTDAGPADARLPWYQLKPGEFPPHHSEHLVTGELVEADFIHRSGQFRTAPAGELVDFKLLPFGTVSYLNAGGDLRDVPLGTSLQFALYQDESGAFTRAAAIRDDFSVLAAAGTTYRLDEARLGDGTLRVTKQGPGAAGAAELRVNERTRVWKGDRQITLRDLVAGDSLLVDLSGGSPPDSIRCTDIWAGADAQRLATARQRGRHTEFLKERGLPGRIERVEGKRLAVTLFGDPEDLAALFKAEGIDPARWATERRRVHAVVANQDLRTYNPPVDGQGSTIVGYERVPTDCFGCGGVSWVIEPGLLLEGFRRGRIVRLFANPSWPVRDMPFGEGVYTETPGARVEEESPNQYPFRTDFGNEDLPWYQLKPGEFPPYQSQHTVGGELVKMDAARRSGRFRADRTGEMIDFTMPPFGTALYHKAEAGPGDLPLGTHYLFFLHQDHKGAFTRATLVMDDFTNAVTNDRVTYRLDEADLPQGRLLLARHLGPMKDERDHLVQPPDLGRGEYAVDGDTRVWKGDARAKLSDLAAGDELLINLTGRTTTSRGRCTEILAGAEAHRRAADRQRAVHDARQKEQGLPAWVDRVDGKDLTITFFAASRADFPALLGGDPWGKSVSVVPVDEELRPRAATRVKMGFKNHLPEGDTAGTYGCSGVRWVLESRQDAPAWKPGQIIRLWKEDWPVKSIDVTAEN